MKMCNRCDDIDNYRIIAEKAERDKNRYFVIIIILLVALVLALIFIFYRTFIDSQYDYIEYDQCNQTGENNIHINITKESAKNGRTESQSQSQE